MNSLENFLDEISSSSEDEKDHETREERRKREITRRKMEIERKKRTADENFKTPSAKMIKTEDVKLSEALGWEIFLIGDDAKRDIFEISIPKIVKHFVGDEEEFENELKQIKDLKELEKFVKIRHRALFLKENEEGNRMFHMLLDTFSIRILSALIRITKIRNVERKVLEENSEMFSKAWISAHEREVRKKKEFLKDLQGLFLKKNREEQEMKNEIKNITRCFLTEELNVKEDLEVVTEELSQKKRIIQKLSFEMESVDPIHRDTSPPRFQNRLSKKTIDTLVKGIEDLCVNGDLHSDRSEKIRKRRPQIKNKVIGNLDCELCSSSDEEGSGADFFSIIQREKELLVDSMMNKEKLEKKIVEKPKFGMREKKKVQFVVSLRDRRILEMFKKMENLDYESPLNRMFIYATPLDWYTFEGDEGTTLATMNISLSEGWDMFSCIYPKRKQITVSRYKLKPYSNRSVDKMAVRFVEENSDDFFASKYRLVNLIRIFEHNLPNLLLSIRNGFWRDFLPVKKNRKATLERVKALIYKKNGIVVDYNFCINHLEENKENGVVNGVLIFSDWRLGHMKNSAFINADLRIVPTTTGNLCFHLIKKLLRPIVECRKLDFHTIIFAFGGNSDFETETISRFLVYIYKLTMKKRINVHWVENNWYKMDENIWKNNADTIDKEEFNREEEFNKIIEEFILQMNRKGIENFYFQKINEKIRNIDNNDNLEIIYYEYARLFYTKCGVYINSNHFPISTHHPNNYMEDDNLRPIK